MIVFKNYTPHPVMLLNEEGFIERTWPSLGCARIRKYEAIDIGYIDQVPMYISGSGIAAGLPDPETGVYYIVSNIVYEAMIDRDDLVVPYSVIRDDQGEAIGCKGFRK